MTTVEGRVGRLEGLYESLATKEDIASLKGELKEDIVSLKANSRKISPALRANSRKTSPTSGAS
jgi:hypothetical protein